MTKKKDPKDLLPVGRKSKYRPEMCEEVIEYGKQGLSRTQTAEKLDTSIQSMITWEKEHPEFLEATTRARQSALAWWEDKGQEGLFTTTEPVVDENGKKIGQKTQSMNAAMWSLQVRNRFPDHYRDSATVNHNHSGTIKQEMTDRELAREILFMLQEQKMKTIEHDEETQDG